MQNLYNLAEKLNTIHKSHKKTYKTVCYKAGLPRWCRGKGSACQCRRRQFNPWVKKIPGGGNGNPLQYSCLENPIDREVWGATVQRVAESDTTEHSLLIAEKYKVLIK